MSGLVMPGPLMSGRRGRPEAVVNDDVPASDNGVPSAFGGLPCALVGILRHRFPYPFRAVKYRIPEPNRTGSQRRRGYATRCRHL